MDQIRRRTSVSAALSRYLPIDTIVLIVGGYEGLYIPKIAHPFEGLFNFSLACSGALKLQKEKTLQDAKTKARAHLNAGGVNNIVEIRKITVAALSSFTATLKKQFSGSSHQSFFTQALAQAEQSLKITLYSEVGSVFEKHEPRSPC